MDAPTSVMWTLENLARPWLTILADASLKGLAVLALAAAAATGLRRTSAAARQLPWLLAMAALLALPVLSLALPGWQVLPEWMRLDRLGLTAPANALAEVPPPPPANADPIRAPDYVPDDAEYETAPIPAVAPPVMVSAPPPGAEPSASGAAGRILSWAMLVWLAGMLAGLAPLALGWIGLWRLKRTALPTRCPALQAMLQQAKARLGLNRPVRLLESPRPAMPMIWGILRPTLLLPAEAASWPAQRQWIVLLHELGHARRWDCLARLVGHLACAMYWFNPLAWLALRRLQSESERACDDLVLSCGSRPCDYAEHLLAIASRLQVNLLTAHSGIAMARPGTLEQRLRAILDEKRNRRRVTAIGLLVAALAAGGIVLPLSVMKAGESRNARSAPATAPAVRAPSTGSGQDASPPATQAVTQQKDTGGEWIEGRVTDRLGRPVQGAMVSLLLADEHQVKTDSEGGFRYPLPSEYLEGGALKRRTWAFVSCPERNLAGVAEIEGLHDPVTVRLQPAITLRGRVLDPGGKVVPGARIGMKVHDPAPERLSWAGGFQHEEPTFDADGKFQIRGLPAGCRYTLSTGAPGFGQASREVDTGAARDGVLEIPPTVLRAANLAVSGIVIGPDDSPVGGARLFLALEGSPGQPSRQAVADPQGWFKMDGVCSGRLTLAAGSEDRSMHGVAMAEGGQDDVRVYLVSSRACVLPSPDKPVTLVGRPLPDLSDVGLDASATRGKPLLICFWNSAQIQSQQALCDLSARRPQLAAKGVTVLGVLAFARNQQHLRYWLEKQAVDMPMGVVRHESLTDYVGMVRCLDRWGVRSLPWFIIADEAGIVQAEGFQMDDLDQAVGLVRVARPRHESPTQPAVRAPSTGSGQHPSPQAPQATSATQPAAGQVTLQVARGGTLEVAVRDEETGQPITGTNVYVMGKETDASVYAETDAAGLVRFRLAAGQYLITRLFAKGYNHPPLRPTDPGFTVAEGQTRRLDLTLRRLRQISGVVQDESGRPVPGAVVELYPPSQAALTDGEGRFSLLKPDYPDTATWKTLLIIRHAGKNLAAVVEVPDPEKAVQAVLKPAAVLAGRVTDPQGQPIPGALVALFIWQGAECGGGGLRLSSADTHTDKDGRYQINGVPYWEEYSVNAWADAYGQDFSQVLRPGPKDGPVAVQPIVLRPANSSVAGTVVDERGNPLPGVLVSASGAGQLDREGRTDESGRFRIEGLCAGPLTVQAQDDSLPPRYAKVKAEGGQNDVKVVLTRGKPGLTRPDTEREQAGPKVGDAAPDFQVPTLDGKTVRLSDYKGRFVLLDFWATWCGPCVGETPNLKAVYEAFGNDPRFVMIALSLDRDAEAPKRYVEKNALKWVQGFLGDWSKTNVPDQYGVSGIPEIMLIGADGKILAKGLRGTAIKAAVAGALSKAETPTTQPATQPDMVWGTDKGLRARIEVGRYLTKRLGMEVSLKFENVSNDPLAFGLSRRCLSWTVLDAQGKEVKPVGSRWLGADPGWHSLVPGQSVGRIFGSADSNRDGRLVAADEWRLKPGRYSIQCTLMGCSDETGKPSALPAWKGKIDLPAAGFEVIGEVGDDDLVAAAGQVRAAQPAGGEAMWRALAELVRPGMTVRQMELALPPRKTSGGPSDIPMWGGIVWSGCFFVLTYALDDQFGVEASGIGAPPPADPTTRRAWRLDYEDMVLTAKPGIKPHARPATLPATVRPGSPQTQPAGAEAEADALVRKRLAQVVPKLEFSGIAFSDVVQFLRDVSNCTINVNWTALEAAGTGKDALVNVKLANVTFEKALRTILDDIGRGNPKPLDFIVLEGAILISTKESLDRTMTVVRVYDVRDLIASLPEPPQPRPMGWQGQPPASAPAPSTGSGPATQPVTRQELLDNLLKLIRETIAPDTWIPEARIGSIRELGGQLVVTQTPVNHEALLALIQQLRQARSLQILTEWWVVDPGAEGDAALREWLAEKQKVRLDNDARAAVLTGDVRKALLEQAGGLKGVRLLAVPRVTTFSGKAVCMTTGERVNAGLARLDEPGKTAAIEFAGGLSLSLVGTVSADRRSVHLTLAVETAELTADGEAAYQTTRSKAAATTAVPADRVLLLRLRMPQAAFAAHGVRRETDPASGKAFDKVVETPLPEKPERFVYVLIQPSVIVQPGGF